MSLIPYAGSGRKPTTARKKVDGLEPSSIIKRSMTIGKRNTSVSMEKIFFDALAVIARQRRMPMSNLVEEIDRNRKHANLSSAIRIFIFEKHTQRPTEAERDQETSQVK